MSLSLSLNAGLSLKRELDFKATRSRLRDTRKRRKVRSMNQD